MNLELYEDSDSATSFESDRVITDSAGTFQHLRGLFSSESVQAAGNGASEQAPCMTGSSLEGDVSALNSVNGDESNSYKVRQSVKGLYHDQGVTHNNSGGLYHDQGAECNITGDRLDKKRKVISESDLSTPSSDEKNVSASAKEYLFPVFTKACEIQEKGAKEKKKEKRDKKDKFLKSVKQRKTKIDMDQGSKTNQTDKGPEDIVDQTLSITEDNLEVVDVRTMVDLDDRVKKCVKELNNAQRGYPS